jgi:hypothetical protein
LKLTPAHRELIRLLAEAAVNEFLEEQQSQEKPMEAGERPHAFHRSNSD